MPSGKTYANRPNPTIFGRFLQFCPPNEDTRKNVSARLRLKKPPIRTICQDSSQSAPCAVCVFRISTAAHRPPSHRFHPPQHRDYFPQWDPAGCRLARILTNRPYFRSVHSCYIGHPDYRRLPRSPSFSLPARDLANFEKRARLRL